MNTVIYKPFKRSSQAWALDTEKTKENENKRRSFLVKIGVQKVVDSDTGEEISTAPVTEYIYEDILRMLFTDPEEYQVRVNLGCEPQLVVTYENRLVVHNDEMSETIERVRNVISTYKKEDIAEVLINSYLNFMTLAPLSKGYRKLISDINDKAEGYFAPDFVGLVLREYFFEQMRHLSQGSYEEDIHFMNSTEFREEMGKAMAEKDNGKVQKLKDELFYSFLLGDTIPNPKIKI